MNLFLTAVVNLETFIILLIFKKYLFMEFEDTRQKKTTLIFLIIQVSLVILALFADRLLPARENAPLLTKVLIEVFMLIGEFLPFAVVMISSFRVRKKHKWIGLLIPIPLIGYFDITNSFFVICLSAICSNQMLSSVLSKLMPIGIFGIVFLVKPSWFVDYRENIEKYTLKHRETVIIWLVGIWMLVEDITYVREDKSAEIITIVMSFILVVMIMWSVVSSVRGEHYYEKNIDMQKNLIEVMADLVENRDESTGGHIQRTAFYTRIIASRLMKEQLYTDILTQDYIKNMVIAAPLHDIGKISVPDSVLKKEGRLTNDEYETIKEHSARGSVIIDQVEQSVGDIDYLVIAREMARSHHERWDGNGYPDKLKGEMIPLSARILAVADVFDALISKRCYKEPMPLDKAYGIIEEGVGTQFDPMIAKAFLDSKYEIEKVIKEYDD